MPYALIVGFSKLSSLAELGVMNLQKSLFVTRVSGA